MDIAIVDYWANNKESILHRASALSKILAVGMIITAILISRDPFVVIAIYLTLVALIIFAGLPWVRILLLGAYPAVFALLLAAAYWRAGWVGPLNIVARALAAALAMLMLITTTPYPDIFALFGRFMPTVISDALFVTYRSLFVLLELMDHLLTGLRLRIGLGRKYFIRNLQPIATALGALLIHSFDRSQRLYDVMKLRGYRGGLSGSTRWRQLSLNDLLPLSVGGLILSGAVFLRIGGGFSSLSTWILIPSALPILLLAGVLRWKKLSR